MTSPSKPGYTPFNGGSIQHWKVARKRTKKAATSKIVRTANGWRIEYQDGGIKKRSTQEWNKASEAQMAMERGEIG
jgi:hypothetical protein